VPVTVSSCVEASWPLTGKRKIRVSAPECTKLKIDFPSEETVKFFPPSASMTPCESNRLTDPEARSITEKPGEDAV
jgi:hypothetical protein